MAAPLGSIYTELKIDSSDFTKKEREILESSKEAARSIEKNWKVIGEKSDLMYDAMAIQAKKAYQKIVSEANISTEAQARAQAGLANTLAGIHAKRSGLEKNTGDVSARVANETINNNKKVESSFSGLTPVIVSNYLAYLALQKTINAITNEFRLGFSAVEDYKVNVAAMAGFITTFSEQAAKGDLAGAFSSAYGYSEKLVQSLEKMDALTIASGEDLKVIAMAFIKNGVLLDVNNEKQRQGFLNTATALKAIFPSQKDQLQMNQEISALMAGQFRAGDKLAQALKAVNPNIEANLASWKQSGKVLENIGDMLAGFGLAADKLQMSWATIGSTLDTIHVQILREGFKPVVEDILDIALKTKEALIDTKGELTPLAKEIQQNIADTYEGTKKVVEIGAGMAAGWVAATAAAKLYQIAITDMTAAQIALNIATKANPWVILATAGVGAGVWANQWMRDMQAATDATNALNAATKKVAETVHVGLPTGEGRSFTAAGGSANLLASHTRTLDLIRGSYTAPALKIPETEEQIKAKADAQKKYRDLMNSTLAEEEQRLIKIHEQYREGIAIVDAQYELGEISAEQAEGNQEALTALMIRQTAESKAAIKAKKDANKEENQLIKDRIAAIKEVQKYTKELHDEDEKQREERAKALETLDEYILRSTDSQAHAIKQVNDAYWQQIDVIMALNEVGDLSNEDAEKRLSGADRARKANLDALNETKDAHEKATKVIPDLWDHAAERMTDSLADWLATGENGLAGFEQSFRQMVSQMVSTWIMGQKSMTSAQSASMGGNLALASTMMGGSSGYAGYASAGLGILNELYNPGAYGASSAALQSNMAGALAGLGLGTTTGAATVGAFGAGGYGAGSFMASNFAPVGTGTVLAPTAGTGAAGSIGGMSSAAFGAATAGIGTFVTGMLSGQDFKQSAVSGAGAAGGAYIGTMILPGIGTIVGSVLGSQLGGLFGDKENEFTLSELSPKTDETWSRYGGLTPNNTIAPPGGGAPFYPPIQNAYIGAMNEVQAQFNAQTERLKGQMSASAWDAFSTALEKKKLTDTNSGRWRVSQAQEAIEGSVTKYAKTLNEALDSALKAALPIFAKEFTADSAAFKVLTNDLQNVITQAINSKTFGLDQFNELGAYFNAIEQAMAPITEIIDTSGLTDYEKQIRNINLQFDNYGQVLQSAGVDLAKYTELEKARVIALKEVDQYAGIASRAGLVSKNSSLTENALAILFNSPRFSLSNEDVTRAYADREQGLNNMVSEGQTLAASLLELGEELSPVPDNLKNLVLIVKDSEAAVSAFQRQYDIGNFQKVGFTAWGKPQELEAAKTFKSLQDGAQKARELLEKEIGNFFAPVTEIIESHTMSEFAASLRAINKELTDNVDAARKLSDSGILSDSLLTDWMASINSAADYQTQDLINKWITPITDSWKTFFEQMTVSDLAPTSSLEAQKHLYTKYMGEAVDGIGNDAEDAAKLQNFLTSEYLPFMQKYYGSDVQSGGYQAVYKQTMADMKSLSGVITVDTKGLSDAVVGGMVSAIQKMDTSQPVTINLQLDGRTLAVGNSTVTRKYLAGGAREYTR